MKDDPNKRIHFWIDTLCVSLWDSTKPSRHEDADLGLLKGDNTIRRKAIRKMRNFYQNAKKTLVISFVLTQIGLDPLDRAAHLATSFWNTRL